MYFKNLFADDWYDSLQDYLESREFLEITLKIIKERTNLIIYPEPQSNLLFQVFRTVPLEQVKVVILGQDPYHDGSYDGLAFSNTNSEKISPSLRNILKEVNNDIYNGQIIEPDSSLYRWAQQGVFLVNTAHTVIKGQPNSHLHYWKNFTIKVIETLNKKDNIVWMLWGNEAKKYREYILNDTHSIIESGHPSPLNTSIPFVGSKCFSKCNEILKSKNINIINW
jgi:uracil-DNA glycosylase